MLSELIICRFYDLLVVMVLELKFGIRNGKLVNLVINYNKWFKKCDN